MTQCYKYLEVRFKKKWHGYVRLPQLARWILVAVALVISNISGWCKDGAVVSGQLNVKMFAGETSIVPSMCSTNSFKISLSADGRFVIEVRPIYLKGNVMYGKEEILYLTFDGTNTYFVHYTEAVSGMAKGRPVTVNSQPLDTKRHEAYISSGDYPFSPLESQKRENILWLVYGAGEAIHRSSLKTMPLPWVPARWNLLSFGFRLEYELSSDPPYVPRDLKFVRDVTLDLKNAEEWDRPELDNPSNEKWVENWRESLDQRNRIFTDKTVIGQLHSENFIHTNGVTIPFAFQFEVFQPDMVSKTKVRRRYLGLVTNVGELPTDQLFQPPIIANLSIHDSRFRYRDTFRQLDAIDYKLQKNDEWKPQDDPLLQLLSKEQLTLNKAVRFRPGFKGKIRLIVTIIFVALALPLPVLLYRHASKKNREHS